MAELRRRQTPTRSLGWEMAYPGWSAGDACSANTLGHTGFTGTGLWIRLRLGPSLDTAYQPGASDTAQGQRHRGPSPPGRRDRFGGVSAPLQAAEEEPKAQAPVVARLSRGRSNLAQDVLQHPVDRCQIGGIDTLGQTRFVGARHRNNRFIDFAALRAELEESLATVRLVGAPVDQATLDQRSHRARNLGLVHAAVNTDVPRRHLALLTERCNDPPLGNDDAERLGIFPGKTLGHQLGEDIEPVGQEFVERERFFLAHRTLFRRQGLGVQGLGRNLFHVFCRDRLKYCSGRDPPGRYRVNSVANVNRAAAS